MAAVIGFGIWLADTKEPMRLSGTAEKVAMEPKVVENKELIQKKVVNANIERVELAVAKKVVRAAQPKNEITTLNSEAVSKTSSSPKVAVLASTPEAAVAVETKSGKNQQENYNTGPVSGKEPSRASAVVMSMAADMEAQSAEEVEQPKRQRRIKSVGSLVNFVVSKVDKRNEKIIEFEDGDEGTKVSSLNLGLLKFKAKD
jgi:hypothetical protein